MSDNQVAQTLKTWKQKQDTLYDHLCQIADQISSPQFKVDQIQNFERISHYFKQIKYKHKEPLKQGQLQWKNKKQIKYPEKIINEENAYKLSKQFKKNKKFGERLIQNFDRDAKNLFSQVGYSLGSQKNDKLNIALKVLAEKQNAYNIRFWGKILTRNGDYLVMQGECKKNKEPIVTGDMQKYHEGVNYYSYWVCNRAISEDWYELPLVTPEQIRTSRLIKYMFTGKLTEKIKSYPVFNGQQRHLLKCQLVRITHNCQIVPNGLYARGEQNPDEIDFAQQFKMPEFNDLTNLENWVHLNPYILEMGRANYYADPKLSPQQKQELFGKLSESDPKNDRLKGINEDKPVQKLGMQGCWVPKQVGNLQTFNNIGKDEGTTSCYGVVTLKNPHWPGWVTVANSKGFGSIYIGYGYKLTQNCFYPSSPQDLLQQGQDTEEFGEPNPKDPPDELESDSDDENKKPDE